MSRPAASTRHYGAGAVMVRHRKRRCTGVLASIALGQLFPCTSSYIFVHLCTSLTHQAQGGKEKQSTFGTLEYLCASLTNQAQGVGKQKQAPPQKRMHRAARSMEAIAIFLQPGHLLRLQEDGDLHNNDQLNASCGIPRPSNGPSMTNLGKEKSIFWDIP